jgi:shikimate kinase
VTADVIGALVAESVDVIVNVGGEKSASEELLRHAAQAGVRLYLRAEFAWVFQQTSMIKA